MSRLHICNTFFERELEVPSNRSLFDWMHAHPPILQLQFLPLLYAAPDDQILVTALPDNPDPRLRLTAPDNALPIEHWGPSLAIAAWAHQHHLPYTIPDWETVRKINSKVFSFTESPKLPGAKLLNSQEEVIEWILTTPGPKVLKTPFGTAGSGHLKPNVKQQYTTPKIATDFRGPQSTNVKRLYITPLIGEPWVERVLDFSTQWEKGQLIGTTLFENEPNGTYKGTHVGDVESWALEEHLAIAKPLVERIVRMGYMGNLGIDAFIYLWEGKKRLHPIVEINARKTMSWAALQLPSKSLYYTKNKAGLLPSRLGKTEFTRNIVLKLPS